MAVKDKKRTGVVPTLVSVVILLVIWQIAALVVGQDIILVAPAQVVTTLIALVPEGSFWATIAASLVRIVVGFLVAFVVGTLTAWLASVNRWLGAFMSTTMRLIRSIPVVSFIILLLIWANSTYLSLWVSFLMVVPVVFSNAEEGFANRDIKLVQMAQVFGFSAGQRWWAIAVPTLMPYLIAATRVGFGLAWKAGISAEVIGMPRGSIGERLYQAKVYLSTADLFAWTAVIVALSYICEKLALWGLRGTQAGLKRYAS
ncbi:MAG: ABC transporter permease subunit [Propionibacteriaceae bacterium]|nr:ABC transporter permease subunit [Propionibacteriaceae bacterium]